MAPNFLALATTLENLGARWLLAKKVNFVPCKVFLSKSNRLDKKAREWRFKSPFCPVQGNNHLSVVAFVVVVLQ